MLRTSLIASASTPPTLIRTETEATRPTRPQKQHLRLPQRRSTRHFCHDLQPSTTKAICELCRFLGGLCGYIPTWLERQEGVLKPQAPAEGPKSSAKEGILIWQHSS